MVQWIHGNGLVSHPTFILGAFTKVANTFGAVCAFIVASGVAASNMFWAADHVSIWSYSIISIVVSLVIDIPASIISERQKETILYLLLTQPFTKTKKEWRFSWFLEISIIYQNSRCRRTGKKVLWICKDTWPCILWKGKLWNRWWQTVCQYQIQQHRKNVSEAHKNYLDVHVMIHGNEQIDLNFIQNMELKDFVKTDFLPMDGEKNSSVVLTDGDFLIYLSTDI